MHNRTRSRAHTSDFGYRPGPLGITIGGVKPAVLPLFLMLACVAGAQPPRGPIMSSILPRYEIAKLNLIEAAEQMPAGEYSYRLTPPQRSFGEWIDHNAKMNYSWCAQAIGEPAPTTAAKVSASSPKAELVDALKASFAYCDPVFSTMTDEKAVQSIGPEGKKVYPVDRLVGLLANWNEHYGNLVGYLRTKGLTPPSTLRAQKAAAKK